MTRKAVFLDVDGTLLNDRGLVPDSARSAVQQARANGHLVFLCTGRSLPELWHEIMNVGFDGVIAAAGGYVEVDGQVLTHQNVPVDQVRRVVEYFDCPGDQLLPRGQLRALRQRRGQVPDAASVLYGGVTDEDVLAELQRVASARSSTHVDCRRGPGARGHQQDLVPRLRRAVRRDPGRVRRHVRRDPGHRPAVRAQQRGAGARAGSTRPEPSRPCSSTSGIPVEDTMAYGDGHNDLEMLEYVDVGVAMGNAHPSGQGRRRRHHRHPRRGRHPDQLHQVRSDLRPCEDPLEARSRR